MSHDLHQIIYISTAESVLNEDALLDLLSKSQKRNAARGITGLLLHSDGNIIQIMEGPEHAVTELFAKIARDPRHRGVLQMSSKAIAQRDFPNYKMGFKRARTGEFQEQIPNFSKVVDEGGFSKEDFEGVSRLVTIFLKTFARSTNIDRFDSD